MTVNQKRKRHMAKRALFVAIENEEKNKSFNRWKATLPERLAKQQLLKEQRAASQAHVLEIRIDRKARRAIQHEQLLAKRANKKVQKTA